MAFVLESPRLTMHEFTPDDYEWVIGLLGDPDVMRFWPAPYARDEAIAWIDKQVSEYRQFGVAYWLARSRATGKPIGLAGILMRSPLGTLEPCVGYIFAKEGWGKGLASEAAAVCFRYGLDVLGAPRVLCMIRPENVPSLRVAARLRLLPIAHTIYFDLATSYSAATERRRASSLREPPPQIREGGYPLGVLSQAEFNDTHIVHRLEGITPPREYVIHTPRGWDGQAPVPLLFMIHGGGGTPRTAAYATGVSRAADDLRFLVAYPAALPRDPRQPVSFLRNPTFWNVGSGFGHAERLRIDDTMYIRTVLDDTERRYPVDRDRIFVAGFSNGAALALRVAVDLSDRIRAVTAIAGHLWRRDQRPARPIPLLYMIGTADPIVPPGGGLVRGPWGSEYSLPPIRETIELWARWAGIETPPRTALVAPGVTLEEFGPGDHGATVRFLTIDGAGHVWPGGPAVLNEKISGPSTDRLDATAAMLEFFGLS